MHLCSFAAEIVQHIEGELDLGVRLIPKRDRRLLIRAQAHLMRDAIRGNQWYSVLIMRTRPTRQMAISSTLRPLSLITRVIRAHPVNCLQSRAQSLAQNAIKPA